MKLTGLMVHSKRNTAGVGLVIRNHNKEVEAVMTEGIPTCFDAEHAEAIGFLKALEFAKEFGITHFELEGDALCVLNKLKSSNADLSMTGHIIEGIKHMIKDFPDVKLSFVSRKHNAPAHEAAKLALYSQGRNVWFSNFPTNVMEAVLSDSV